MNVQFILHNEIREEELLQICMIKDENWPYGIDEQKKWIFKNLRENDIHVLLYDEKKILVGYTNLVKREATINEDFSTCILGVGNVCVSNSLKKTGMGKIMMANINNFLNQQKLLGILFCKDSLVAFYEKCGWKLVNSNAVTAYFSLSHINTMTNIFDNINLLKISGSSF